jgi:phospholipid transport system transporter-binding protein
VGQLEKQGNRILVRGPMTMQTVNALLSEAPSQFNGSDMEIDLAQVTEVDSGAVSLLFEWLRQAFSHNASLVFVNLPDTLHSLALLYGVDGIIPYTH